MEKISIYDLNLKDAKVLSKNNRSQVYKLCDGQVLKIFNQNISNLYKNFGNSIENKILEAEVLPDIPEIVVPNKAVYSKDGRFRAYTSNYVTGLNLGDYYDSLEKDDRNSLKFYASLFARIESAVNKANRVGFVFPDLANPSNIIFDKDGNFKLIDYDGMQIKDNKAMVISKVLCPDEQYIGVPKYSKENHLYTEQLDKKSIIILYMLLVFNIKLTLIGRNSFPDGELITLDYIFNYIGLNDADLMHKIWKIYSKDDENEFISEDIYRLSENYNLELKPAIEIGKNSCKCLIKKR